MNDFSFVVDKLVNLSDKTPENFCLAIFRNSVITVFFLFFFGNFKEAIVHNMLLLHIGQRTLHILADFI